MITKTLDVDFVNHVYFVALCETLCRLSEFINNIVVGPTEWEHPAWVLILFEVERALVVRVERFVAEALLLRASFVVEFAARYVHSPRNALGFRILRSYSNSLCCWRESLPPHPYGSAAGPGLCGRLFLVRDITVALRVTPTSLWEVRAVRSIYIFLSRLV